jgi:hypothetical protein
MRFVFFNDTTLAVTIVDNVDECSLSEIGDLIIGRFGWEAENIDDDFTKGYETLIILSGGKKCKLDLRNKSWKVEAAHFLFDTNSSL